MCGIAGLLGREDRALVSRMCDHIAHRGPDGHGLWSNPGITMGHRRLAIVDIDTGQQPMVDRSGRFIIVYNGEVYNHRAIRLELEALGARFQTASDTEVILEGYRVWGTGILARLEGMFAFALWDVQEKQLLLARDPWGIKPLFFAQVGDELLWASEQKALFAHPDVKPVVDVDRVREQGALEFLTANGTLFQGIHQLPPGTFAQVKIGQAVAPKPYPTWGIERFADPVEAAQAIHERLVTSVREQLMGEVPVGTVLSGGLDSAAVALIHQEASNRPVHTFTIAENDAVDDFQVAHKLAEKLGTNHHEGFFAFEDVVRDLPRHAWHNENMNYTEFFFFPLFERMAKTVKVGLCGQGSDEHWGGYARYKAPHALRAERVARLASARPENESRLEAEVRATHGDGESLARFDQEGQLGNFQLRLVDRNSMAHSLEVRVPFLSRPLQQASNAVPWDWKVHEGIEKWVLRKSLEGTALPKDIVWRKKVPAGRSTSPTVMQRFEELAAKLRPQSAIDKHPLRGAFQRPAEYLMYDLWREVFVQREGRWQGLTLEDLS